MSAVGDTEVLRVARSALLDALEALAEHRSAVIVIGAQAIYLHTGAAQVALAEATKDSDIMLNTEVLADHPLLEDALTGAGFQPDPHKRQPGSDPNRHNCRRTPAALGRFSGKRGYPESAGVPRRTVRR